MENIRTFNFGEFRTKTLFCSPDEALGDGLLVFDENTVKIFPPNNSNTTVIIPPGEKEKHWESIDEILQATSKNHFGRDDVICGIGGGVICDMAAFAASVYMRGCSLILVPTTLLAMADASLGGKTGIDYQGYKNMVGSFYPASEVRYCPQLLKSLPEKEYLSGLGEVIKTAMVGDKGLFHYLIENRDLVLKRDMDVLKEIIGRCILVKGKVVEEDLYEKGVRATLNLGHTFGHALESVTGFSEWTHGEAVAWGLYMAMETGLELGLTDRNYVAEVRKILENYKFKLYADIETEKLLNAMNYDKKKKNGKVRYVLQRNIEESVVLEVDRDVIFRVLEGSRKKAGEM